MNVIKKFGVDFYSFGGALTLPPSAVREGHSFGDGAGGPFSRKHDSGWTITGIVHEDYYEWVNDFEAIHPVHGRVGGNFESEVRADSEEGFAHFWKRHEPDAWDYMDI